MWWISKQIYKMWQIYKATDHSIEALNTQLPDTDLKHRLSVKKQRPDTDLLRQRSSRWEIQTEIQAFYTKIQHRSTNLQANLQDISDLQLNLQDLSDLQQDLQPDLHWQWPIQWQIQWTLSLMLISDLTFEHQQWKQKLWRWNRWDHHNYRYNIEVSTTTTNTDNRWTIQYCNWIFSQIYRWIYKKIYRPIFKSKWIYSQIYEDLELHNTLLWCCFHYRQRPQLKEKTWEELVNKAPTMWVVSYLRSTTGIYTLHESTRLTTSLDLHPNIQCSNPEHTALPMGNPVTQSMWLILQFQMQCSTINGIVSRHPTMCHCFTPKTQWGTHRKDFRTVSVLEICGDYFFSGKLIVWRSTMDFRMVQCCEIN